MHKPAIAPLVFSRLFPALKPTDPTSLQAHITRNLVPEVQSETACFYGPIECLEAQYPGLDYANPAHRTRLGRFFWHRRLFKVFDELRLSDHEIQSLCRWEGTRWARERYERDERVTIRDTTWDDVEMAVHADAVATKADSSEGTDGEDDLEMELDGAHMSENPGVPENVLEEEEIEDEDARGHSAEEDEDEDEDEDGADESEDELQQSIGVELNQRLLLATAARARGEEVVLDEDWEQWLKEAAERGTVPALLRFTNSRV